MWVKKKKKQSHGVILRMWGSVCCPILYTSYSESNEEKRLKKKHYKTNEETMSQNCKDFPKLLHTAGWY